MLSEPSDTIGDQIAAFNAENLLAERAMTELILALPSNRLASHALLKIIAVNRLYYSGIGERIGDLA
jgi:hypothetical protein